MVERIFEVLLICEQQDRIPVDDLSYAIGMLSKIGVKQKYNSNSKARAVDNLNEMYQYWY